MNNLIQILLEFYSKTGREADKVLQNTDLTDFQRNVIESIRNNAIRQIRELDEKAS